jgi:ATP-dependent RNA helicase DHX36
MRGRLQMQSDWDRSLKTERKSNIAISSSRTGSKNKTGAKTRNKIAVKRDNTTQIQTSSKVLKISQMPSKSTKKVHRANIPKPTPRSNNQIKPVDLLPEGLVLPSFEEVPGMPKNLLHSPAGVLLKRLGNKRDARIRIVPSKKNGRFNAKITIILPGHDTFGSIGEGSSRVVAERMAALRVIADLHAKSLVKELYPLEPEAKESGFMVNNANAILDVYNYCSHYMAVPKVDVSKFRPFVAEPKASHIYKCTIELKEQGISVSGFGPDFPLAEALAARKFKAAAEAHIAGSGKSNLLIVKNTGLNTENAEQFHEWLKMNDRAYDYKLESTQHASYRETQLHVLDAGQWQPFGPVIQSSGKKRTDPIAYICAARSKIKEDPSLEGKFIAALKVGNGKILRKAAPVDLALPPDSVELMLQTMTRAYASGLEMRSEIEFPSVDEPEQRQRNSRPFLPRAEMHALSQSLFKKHQAYQTSEHMAAMRKIKSDLPMNHYKEDVFRLVENNVYSIIIGATGSGKTTQVPQIILEQYYQNGKGAECEIICTQPRRIAATSVANRVKDELGPDLAAHVGHHVRFDARLPRQGGSVTYCTTGILLQQLQAEPDRIFNHVSHLIIDEVHERDKIIDFTLTILKKIVAERLAVGKRVPKITLMSATLDTELFANYFKNCSHSGTQVNAPVLSVPGRTFPVTERYLDDVLTELHQTYTSEELLIMTKDKVTSDYLEYENRVAWGKSKNTSPSLQGLPEAEIPIDWKTKQNLGNNEVGSNSPGDTLVPYGLVATSIAHLIRTTKDGAILVFFPGLQEMQAVEKLLQSPVLGVDLLDATKFKMFMLHSSIPDTQKTVFSPVSEGIRKIILSTNIGETSITIPDVKYVIDTGKVRETQYDHVKRISSLQSTWISKSNARQRAGRAGRVQDGHYLALYSQERYQSMRTIGLPELLRSDLQATCLTIKSTLRGVDIRNLLAGAIEPPDPVGVDEAVSNLVDLGALTLNEDLTALGKVLASLPIHPTLGKMILLGVMFKCLDPILVIGAAAEERGLFVMAPEVKAATVRIKQSFIEKTQSEHMVTYNAFSTLRQAYNSRGNRAAQNLAWENNVHFGAWKSIYGSTQQMVQILIEHGLVPNPKVTLRRNLLFGGPDLNKNSHKPHIIKAVLLAGLLPNIGLTRKIGIPWRTAHADNVMLPRTCALTNQPQDHDQYLATFTNLVKSSDGKSTFLKDVSIVQPLAVALFANELTRGTNGANMVEAFGWLSLYVKTPGRRRASEAASCLIKFQQGLNRVQVGAFADLATGKPLHGMDRASRMREYFIDKVVEILDMAVEYRSNTQLRGAHTQLELNRGESRRFGWGR